MARSRTWLMVVPGHWARAVSNTVLASHACIPTFNFAKFYIFKKKILEGVGLNRAAYLGNDQLLKIEIFEQPY